MKLAGAALIPLFLIGCGSSEAPVESEPFQRVGSYLTGAHPMSGVIIDVDQDGDQDVIAPALLTGDVIIIENDGGEFIWHQVGPLQVGASETIAADVDSDGALELITSNRDENRVDIYQIEPGPGLSHVGRIDLAGATGLAAADFDGDGDTDLAVTRFRDNLITILAQDQGSLAIATEFDVAQGPFAIRAGDVLPAAGIELVVAAASADRVEVYANDGTEWTLEGSAQTAAWPSSIAVSDGRIFGTANVGNEVFSISVGADQQMGYEPLTPGQGAFFLAFFDVDGESAFAVTNKLDSTVSVFDQATLEPIVTFSTGVEAGPSPVYGWDFDDDGTSDLVVINSFTDEVVIYRGN